MFTTQRTASPFQEIATEFFWLNTLNGQVSHAGCKRVAHLIDLVREETKR
jgi:hypothetical protein